MAAIVTLTMNPALDVSTSTPHVTPSHKLRCAPPQHHAGGGGINVARVLRRLGADCLAAYPRGGATGSTLAQLLAQEDVPQHLIDIEGETRESFSVIDEGSSEEFRFVLPGPNLTEREWRSALTWLTELAPTPDYLVLSGSLPPGVPDDFYAQIVYALKASATRIVLDASGAPLRLALQVGVHLFKPSLRELEELTGQALPENAGRIAAARRLISKQQAAWVALSLGDEGALLVSERHAWFAPAIDVPVATTTGAGDSFVAGLTWAFSQHFAAEDAFVFGVAAATAALLNPGTTLCTTADIARMRPMVRIQAV
ncbi:1-phosphofructokinase family hexose kinase [Aquabacterium sp.]|uniref:1-phosphofructokinase family hexose kinase n=1 Tax=Aquabacterium sp. TaxID=1872578 RepID=UPI002E3329C0|nr:1-phosphofructokinase family hexose kinase [Aquabacterium sp.]HEX5312012.1 1-phosphofructokinase family hexose kinase [Aquabacterium sp.]